MCIYEPEFLCGLLGIRNNNKLEILHLNFNSPQICFV